MEVSAGMAIICDFKRILLVHPTSFGWRNNLGLPKGHVEEGEGLYEAAKRELYEETGIRIDDKFVRNKDGKPFSVLYRKDGEKKPFKKAYIYVAFIKRVQDIGLESYQVPTSQIPMPEEVDHAAFYTKGECEGLISNKFAPFTKFLKE